MKRIKLLACSVLAAAFVFLGGAISPFAVFAEEPKNEPKTSESVLDEELVEETESVENTPNGEVVEGDAVEGTLTFDELLELYKDIAEKQGFNDEWEKALYYIETAASAKKVDAMILVNVAFVLLFIGDRIVKIAKWNSKRKNDTTSKDIEDIKTVNGQQTTAINNLIEEVENEKEAVVESIAREKALAEGVEKQNIAMRALIRGTNIKQDLKDEAFRALNDSDDLCDKAKK